ncbi:hypothetical protein [Knoellia sp. LjRoot47]|uniref:hypothetical protein n=1 Tax=Knoellia sp. LjRoot47 TaxID=3342330 RepID=UPI003ECCA1A1
MPDDEGTRGDERDHDAEPGSPGSRKQRPSRHLPAIDAAKLRLNTDVLRSVAEMQKANFGAIDAAKLRLNTDVLRRVAEMHKANLGAIDATKISLGADTLRRVAEMQKANFGAIDAAKLRLNTDVLRRVAEMHKANLGAIDATKISLGADTLRRVAEMHKANLGAIDATKISLGADTLRRVAEMHKATLPSVDWSSYLGNVLRGVNTSALVERIRRWLPENWSAGVDESAILQIVSEDGLPCVWVPRADILDEVIAAPDRGARVQVLLRHRSEVLDDCGQVLTDVDHDSLAGQRPLADAALRAMREGHDESAQALAVAVTDTVICRLMEGVGGYKRISQIVVADLDLISLVDLRVRAALAPIARFFASWYVTDGTPPPEALSRHVTFHNADATHYTPGNALIATMLMTSVLRAAQERAKDDEDEIA